MQPLSGRLRTLLKNLIPQQSQADEVEEIRVARPLLLCHSSKLLDAPVADQDWQAGAG